MILYIQKIESSLKSIRTQKNGFPSLLVRYDNYKLYDKRCLEVVECKRCNRGSGYKIELRGLDNYFPACCFTKELCDIEMYRGDD